MTTRIKSRTWNTTVFLASIMSASSSLAELPPVRLSGHLGYDYRYNQSNSDGEQSREQTQHGVLFKLNAFTYIWQPWFGYLNGGLGLRFTDTATQEGGSTGNFVSGDVGVKLFPLSRFPFEAFFQRRDTSIDDDDSFDSATATTQYGIRQRYTTLGGTGYRFSYEHIERTFDRDDRNQEEVDVNDIIQLGATRNFDKLNLDFDSTYNKLTEEDSNEETTRFFSVLRHRYKPSTTLSVDGQWTYRQEDFDFGANQTSSTRWQLSEFAFWRPETEKPLLISSALRYIDNTSGSNAKEANTQTLTTNLGASYQVTPNWQLSGNTGVTLTESDSASTNASDTSHFELAAVDYNADRIKLGNSDYDWFGTLRLRNEQEENQDNVQSVELSLGHGISHSFKLFDAPLNVRLNQQAIAVEDSAERSIQTLDHGFSLNWSRQHEASATFVGLTVSDSRSFGEGGNQDGEPEDETRERQFISFQVSRNQNMSRSASWSGDVTVQATRFVTADEEEKDAFEPAASVNLTYRNQRFFDVPRLRFRSSVRLFSDSYFPLLDEVDEPESTEEQRWENRLEYNIGRLDLRLDLNVSHDEDDRTRGLIYFQIRRNFDAIYD